MDSLFELAAIRLDIGRKTKRNECKTHVLGISGGKDSAALAICLKQKYQ